MLALFACWCRSARRNEPRYSGRPLLQKTAVYPMILRFIHTPSGSLCFLLSLGDFARSRCLLRDQET